ncbi:hypothetical protein A5653_24570 [Mycobacterium colombiense]|nr:hypothetical protein A9W93_26085 [Mycobacterium colombiense]OBK63749.1 hypothetical protein A5653_24570 [Mycobacterium colombiense]
MVLHAQPEDQPADAMPEDAYQAASAASMSSSIDLRTPGPLAPSAALRNPFPPIADYAFLSDWETTCLISPAGSVEWLCVPRPDSPSASRTISHPVWVCQVVSMMRLPGRYRRADGTETP